jgi:hypothetical protein
MSTVSISDGVLDIDFEPSANDAIISAIMVFRAEEAVL